MRAEIMIDLGELIGMVDAVVDYDYSRDDGDNDYENFEINSVIVTRGISRKPVDISELPIDDDKLIELIKDAERN